MNIEQLLQQKQILETSLMFHDSPVRLDIRENYRKQLDIVIKELQKLEKKSIDKTKK
jgi:hypothetical protein